MLPLKKCTIYRFRLLHQMMSYDLWDFLHLNKRKTLNCWSFGSSSNFDSSNTYYNGRLWKLSIIIFLMTAYGETLLIYVQMS